jgi:hypothetical protein
LRDALPSYLKGFVTFGYKTGWRFSEIAGITHSRLFLGIYKPLAHGVILKKGMATVFLFDTFKHSGDHTTR